jgi:POT family proton-dependent oligopeptide transporter
MNLVIVLGVIITLASGAPVAWQLSRHHPKGLIVLFMTEMWERFSYYGMRGLLIFYLTQHFLFDDGVSNTQYGSYTSLVWLMPVVGGLIADRWLGTRKAVAFGALLLVAGHLLMAVGEGPQAHQAVVWHGRHFDVHTPQLANGARSEIVVDGKPYQIGAATDGGLKIDGLPAASLLPGELPKGGYTLETHRDTGYLNLFYLALSLIIMGVGFLKGNASSTVGKLYAAHDPRRDPAFTLYYYGINLGSFWAGTLCGWLGQSVGWWAGFGLAGAGMLLGWVVFVLGKRTLEGHGEPPDPARLKQPLFGPVNREWVIYLASLAGVGLIWLVVGQAPIVRLVFSLMSGGVLLYVLWFAITKCGRIARERLMLAIVLVLGATVFWALYEQAGNSMNLFADRNTDLHITKAASLFDLFGQRFAWGSADQIAAIGFRPAHWWNWIDTGMTASQTQNFQPGYLLILAPLFAVLWGFLGRRNLDPNPVLKFGAALLLVGASFLFLVFGARFVDASFRMPLMFLALAYLVQEIGELCLSPVGLSEITKLSPPLIVSTMMAVFFLSNSGGQLVGGWIASLAQTDTVGGQVTDPKASLEAALGVYGAIGWGAIACGVLFLVLAPFIKGWAHGADETAAG